MANSRATVWNQRYQMVMSQQDLRAGTRSPNLGRWSDGLNPLGPRNLRVVWESPMSPGTFHPATM